MPAQHRADELDIVLGLERLEIDHLLIAAAREAAVGVEHVGDAAAHARREVAAGPADHDDAPRGHVLAAVIADAFDHGKRAAVADREPLAGDAAHVGLAAGRAVEADVADDHVLVGRERRLPRRIHDQLAARQPLAPEVVRIALEAHA